MSLPYFPLFVTDFEAKTSHLSLEEDGAYNRLLRIMWITPGCSIPDDPAWISRRLRIDIATFERVVAPIISEFCKRVGGRVISPRLVKEFKKADITSQKRKEAGKLGGRPQAIEKQRKEQKAGESRDKAGLTYLEPEPYIEKIPSNEGIEKKARVSALPPSEFADFWETYPNKVGKPKALESFIKARQRAPLETIMAGLARYVAKQDDRPWCNPTTWLNQDRWGDAPASVPVSRQGSPPKPTMANIWLNDNEGFLIDEYPDTAPKELSHENGLSASDAKSFLLTLSDGRISDFGEAPVFRGAGGNDTGRA